MRTTVKDLRFYIQRINNHIERNIELDIAYGGYKLVWSDTHNDITHRLTCRECYYALIAMYEMVIGMEN